MTIVQERLDALATPHPQERIAPGPRVGAVRDGGRGMGRRGAALRSSGVREPGPAMFMRRWNDDLDGEGRQKLKAFVPRVIGTAGTAGRGARLARGGLADPRPHPGMAWPRWHHGRRRGFRALSSSATPGR